LFVLVSG